MSNNTPATDHSPDAGKMVETHAWPTPPDGQDSGEFAGHTPGPWRIAMRRSLFSERMIADESLGIVADYSGEFPVLCSTTNGLSFHSPKDARLMAAAPRLLRERDELKAELASRGPVDQHNYYRRCGELGEENATLKAEVERMRDADTFSRKELARGNEIIDQLRIERDRLRAENAEQKADIQDARGELRVIGELSQKYKAGCDRLQAENAELLKDKARLDWMETAGLEDQPNIQWLILKHKTLRLAVDAAIALAKSAE